MRQILQLVLGLLVFGCESSFSVVTATVLSPQLVAPSRRLIVSEDGYNIRDCTPPVFHNGTWHLWATRIPVSEGKPGYNGVVAHYYSRVLNATWTFDAIALDVSANHSEWDSHGVFTPGVVYDSTVDTWYLFYGGVGPHYTTHSGSDFSEYQGLATSQSPFGAFTKSPYNPIITTYGPPSVVKDTLPLPTCAANAHMESTNIVGNDLSHAPAQSTEECEARCIAQCGVCAGYTFTTWQPGSRAEHCPKGTPCCWLKSSATQTAPEDNSTSASVMQHFPPGYYDWVRVDNPRPVVRADGRRMLFMKCVRLNSTALPTVFEPFAPQESWAPPYTPRSDASPVIPANATLFPKGFENQEIFMGPDGHVHMMGHSHGGSPAGRPIPHFIALDPTLLRWDLVEMHAEWNEPAPVRANSDDVPSAFIRFEGTPLSVSLYAVTWNKIDHSKIS